MLSRLSRLLAALPCFELQESIDDIVISQVTADSRLVEPGALFVAVQGASVDGHRFIGAALERGAAAVAGTLDATRCMPAGAAVPYVRVVDSRAALAWLAAAFYGFPSRHLRLVGVTGTDGKTTTANLIYQVLETAGWRPGMISTVGARLGEDELDTGLHVTTPEAPDVQRYLSQMVEAGCQAAVVETTSHGLDQGRVDACEFDVAVVTNITHEHLDYHRTWEAYLEAKARLIALVNASAVKPGQPKAVVLNADDASYDRLRSMVSGRCLSYGIENRQADLRAEQVESSPQGLRFEVVAASGVTPVQTQLSGRFNVFNCLAAFGAGLALGLEPEVTALGIASLQRVTGRMEAIDHGQDFLAIVDFAHTPVSLAQALQAVRPMAEGRVIAVFGSAGLRDVAKRFLMAETAVRLSDYAIITAEDPRSEPLEEILAQMVEGARRAGALDEQDFSVIPDRGEAIRRAVELARAGDVVIVCGKGHERSMCFGDVEYAWSDQEVLAWSLEQQLGRTSGPMPYRLPTSRGLEAEVLSQ